MDSKQEQVVDWVLVPAGLLVLGAYHAWLLHRIISRPTTTIIGLNSINRRLWVHAMMEDISKTGILAIQTLRNNMMASTVLASTAITMSSVIAIVMTHAGTMQDVIEDENRLTSSIKFFTLLSCFLIAFLLNVQSIRCYNHAGVLVNVPLSKFDSPYLTVDYVASLINRGSHFWSLGLRAFYFSFPLFLWIFGPVPMFLSSVLMVFLLYFLDMNFEFKGCDDGDDEKMMIKRNSSVEEMNL